MPFAFILVFRLNDLFFRSYIVMSKASKLFLCHFGWCGQPTRATVVESMPNTEWFSCSAFRGPLSCSTYSLSLSSARLSVTKEPFECVAMHLKQNKIYKQFSIQNIKILFELTKWRVIHVVLAFSLSCDHFFWKRSYLVRTNWACRKIRNICSFPNVIRNIHMFSRHVEWKIQWWRKRRRRRWLPRDNFSSCFCGLRRVDIANESNELINDTKRRPHRCLDDVSPIVWTDCVGNETLSVAGLMRESF